MGYQSHLRAQVVLYDQVIVAAREHVFAERVEAQAKYVAAVLSVHGGWEILGYIAKRLVNIPEQHALIVAACTKVGTLISTA